jgi:hypothetical protein
MTATEVDEKHIDVPFFTTSKHYRIGPWNIRAKKGEFDRKSDMTPIGNRWRERLEEKATK